MTGEFAPSVPECGAVHVGGCYNPWADRTWCLCGAVTWPGKVETTHWRPVYSSPGRDGQVIGYEVYTLPAGAS